MKANQQGYIVAYVANESYNSVCFDDVEVSHERLVWQENAYYPFGLAIKPLEREGAPDYRWQYMGVEREEATGWDETYFRPYDNQIGRFFQVDAMAEYMDALTPYHYSYNNPISFNDPTGLCPECEENVANPEQAQVYISEGGATYIYDTETGWVRDEGTQLEEVTVRANKGVHTASIKYSGNLGYDLGGSLGAYRLSSGIRSSRQELQSLHFVGYAASGATALPALPALISSGGNALWSNKGAVSFVYQYTTQSYFYYQETGQFRFYNTAVLSRIDAFDAMMAQASGGLSLGAKLWANVILSSSIDFQFRFGKKPLVRIPLIGGEINSGVNTLRRLIGKSPIQALQDKQFSHVASDALFNSLGWYLGAHHAVSSGIAESYGFFSPGVKSKSKEMIGN